MLDFTDTINVNDEWMFNDKGDETMMYHYNGESYSDVEELKRQIECDVYDELDYAQVDEFINEQFPTIWIGASCYEPASILKSLNEPLYREYVNEYVGYCILNEVYTDIDYLDIEESIDTNGIEVNTYVSW